VAKHRYRYCFKILFFSLFLPLHATETNIVLTKRIMPIFCGQRACFDTFDFQIKSKEEPVEAEKSEKNQTSIFSSGIWANVFLNDEKSSLFGNDFFTNSFLEKTREEKAAIQKIVHLQTPESSAKDKLDSCHQLLEDYEQTIEMFAKSFIQESSLLWRGNLMVPFKTERLPIFMVASIEAASISKNFYANHRSRQFIKLK
jgi:hypothetical protein